MDLGRFFVWFCSSPGSLDFLISLDIYGAWCTYFSSLSYHFWPKPQAAIFWPMLKATSHEQSNNTSLTLRLLVSTVQALLHTPVVNIGMGSIHHLVIFCRYRSVLVGFQLAMLVYRTATHFECPLSTTVGHTTRLIHGNDQVRWKVYPCWPNESEMFGIKYDYIYINFDLNFVALLESLDPFGMASVWSNSNTGKHEKHIQRDHLTHQDASRVGCNFARDTALGTSWRI